VDLFGPSRELLGLNGGCAFRFLVNLQLGGDIATPEAGSQHSK